MMTLRLRKFVLTAHVASSVGWLGAVAVFVALAVTGLTTLDNQLARAMCQSLAVSAWYIVVPLCFASLLTGVIQAVGTKWGLFKHYWIVVKLFLTVAMTLLLLLHLEPINYLAKTAAHPSFSGTKNADALINLVAKAGAAVLALIATTTISIYKPWGRIAVSGQSNVSSSERSKRPIRFYLLIVVAALLVAFVVMHLMRGGRHGH